MVELTLAAVGGMVMVGVGLTGFSNGGDGAAPLVLGVIILAACAMGVAA